MNTKYELIIELLDYINAGEARDFSIIWVSACKARMVYEDSTIKVITVTEPKLLDTAVTEYLLRYAAKLAEIRAKYGGSIGKSR